MARDPEEAEEVGIDAERLGCGDAGQDDRPPQAHPCMCSCPSHLRCVDEVDLVGKCSLLSSMMMFRTVT